MKADKSTLPFCFPKTRLLFCFVQTLQPKGLDMSYTNYQTLSSVWFHLPQFHLQLAIIFFYLSRSLMYISSQQPSMPTHEEVDVLTVKRVTHSEQLAEEVRKSQKARYRQTAKSLYYHQLHMQENYLMKMTHTLCMWKDMLYPDLKENQKRIMSQRVTDMSCTCNKKCSNQSERFLIQINWGKNKLPNIESNFAFEFVVSIFSLVTSFPLQFTSCGYDK